MLFCVARRLSSRPPSVGIQLCMFAYCANYLWQTRHTRKQSLFMLAYISVVFMVEIMFVGVQARTIQICYIDNRVSCPPFAQ